MRHLSRTRLMSSGYPLLILLSGLLLILRIFYYLEQTINDFNSIASHYDPDSLYGWRLSYEKLKSPNDFILMPDSYGYHLIGVRLIFWIAWTLNPFENYLYVSSFVVSSILLISLITFGIQIKWLRILPNRIIHYFIMILVLFPSEELYSPANTSYVVTLPLLSSALLLILNPKPYRATQALIATLLLLFVSKPLSIVFFGYFFAFFLLRNESRIKEQLISIGTFALILFTNFYFSLEGNSVSSIDYYSFIRLLILVSSSFLPLLSHALDDLALILNCPSLVIVGNSILALSGFLLFVTLGRRINNLPHIGKLRNLNFALVSFVLLLSLLLAISVDQPSPFLVAGNYFFSRHWFYAYLVLVILLMRLSKIPQTIAPYLVFSNFVYCCASLIV